MVQATVLILNSILMTTPSLCAEALCDLFCMCDKVHGAGSAASAKAQLDWSCAYKAKTVFFQNETVWTNAAKIQMRQA